MIQIGKDIRAELSEFKGKKYVSIRKYYKDSEGNDKPSNKGITMNLDDWKEFVSKWESIVKDIEGAQK